MIMLLVRLCDLHSTVERGERIPIDTSTALLFQQNLDTPFVSCENGHTHTHFSIIGTNYLFIIEVVKKTYRNSKPSAAVCIRSGLGAPAGSTPRHRQYSAARSTRRRDRGLQPGGWPCDLGSPPAEQRLLAPTDTGCTPPGQTGAGERMDNTKAVTT